MTVFWFLSSLVFLLLFRSKAKQLRNTLDLLTDVDLLKDRQKNLVEKKIILLEESSKLQNDKKDLESEITTLQYEKRQTEKEQSKAESCLEILQKEVKTLFLNTKKIDAEITQSKKEKIDLLHENRALAKNNSQITEYINKKKNYPRLYKK